MSITPDLPLTLEDDLREALDRLDHAFVFGELTLSEYGELRAEAAEWFEERGVTVSSDEAG